MLASFLTMKDIGIEKALVVCFLLHVMMLSGMLFMISRASSSVIFDEMLDYFADSLNYGVTYYMLRKKSRNRAIVSIFKGGAMLIGVLMMCMQTYHNYLSGILPNYKVMLCFGILGILIHLICIWQLYKINRNDSNILSMWICTLNDLISSILLLFAGILVWITGSVLPDVLVSCIIIFVVLRGSLIIFRKAVSEIRDVRLKNE